MEIVSRDSIGRDWILYSDHLTKLNVTIASKQGVIDKLEKKNQELTQELDKMRRLYIIALNEVTASARGFVTIGEMDKQIAHYQSEVGRLCQANQKLLDENAALIKTNTALAYLSQVFTSNNTRSY